MKVTSQFIGYTFVAFVFVAVWHLLFMFIGDLIPDEDARRVISGILSLITVWFAGMMVTVK